MVLLSPPSDVTQRLSEGWVTTIQAACFAPRNTIGTTWSKCLTIVHLHRSLAYHAMFFSRIRTNIRDGHVEFPVTAASWPAFCYPNDKHYSAADIEKGLFRGKVLVKVSLSTHLVLTFRYNPSAGFQVHISFSFIGSR